MPAVGVMLVLACSLAADDGATSQKATVPTPRIESVVMSPGQPQEKDPAVIWYDDFDGPAKTYGEASGAPDARHSQRDWQNPERRH